MRKRSSLLNFIFMGLLLFFTQCGSGMASPGDSSIDNPNTDSLSLVKGSALTDVTGNVYETEIRAVVDVGWWTIANNTTLFYPSNYLVLSKMIDVTLRGSGLYDAATAFKGGLCPTNSLLSYAISKKILLNTTCPSLNSKVTVANYVESSSRAFQLISQAHKDYFNEMVTTYDGPKISSTSTPYGISSKYFKFAYMIGALSGWKDTGKPTVTTFGTQYIKNDQAAAFTYRILMYDIIDQGTTSGSSSGGSSSGSTTTGGSTTGGSSSGSSTTGGSSTGGSSTGGTTGGSGSYGPISGITENSLYSTYYGSWSDSLVQTIIGATGKRKYDLIITHPGTNITPAQIDKMQAAGVKVYCYLSVGEDDTLHSSSFSGGTSGPASGYASWYYDSNGDGKADPNGDWGSYYTNPADANWLKALKTFTNQSGQNWYGYDYSINTLGCDGLFFDTVDTVSPWGPYSSKMSAMVDLIAKIRADIPADRGIIINRGLFYFDTSLVSTTLRDRVRSQVSGVMFENFTDESDYAYWAGKLMTEAVKTDGFSALSLDYSSGSSADVKAICSIARDTWGMTPDVSTVSLDTMPNWVRDYCY